MKISKLCYLNLDLNDESENVSLSNENIIKNLLLWKSKGFSAKVRPQRFSQDLTLPFSYKSYMDGKRVNIPVPFKLDTGRRVI